MQRLMSAYPLLVNDPYFSIWLSGERLNEDRIISWYGKERKMFGIIEVDGVKYCFMGNHPSFNHLKQTNINVGLFKTIFTFENTDFTFNVEFFSPLLINDLKLLTNPSCYVTYTFKALTNIKNVKVSIYFNEEITYEIKDTIRMDVIKASDYEVAYFGKDKQNIFSHSADLINADWGYYYLTGMSCDFFKGNDLSLNNDDSIYMSATNNHNLIEKEIKGKFIVSFDDVVSIFYYGEFLKNYYFSHYNKNIFDAISDFYYNYKEINQKCEKFEKELFEKSAYLGNDYKNIIISSYRQAMAAHKVVEDKKGRLLFLSKENGSDGCIATVDITYPSMPLFLLFNPSLVLGMLYPIVDFARMDVWEFDFAPHDAGVYPYCLGQFYAIFNKNEKYQKNITYLNFDTGVLPKYYIYPKGQNIYNFAKQMPVEECGNMLIISYLLAKETNDISFIKENFDLLNKWADYLKNTCLYPDNQLCTDDFAGPSKHNINLAIKSCVALACFSKISSLLSINNDKYEKIAKERARDLSLLAKPYLPLQKDDEENTYSLKYNLYSDLICSTNLFDKELLENEVDEYIKRSIAYGCPLDTRSLYSKTDWQIWVASLTTNIDKQKVFYKKINEFILNSNDRMPFVDWYYCDSASSCKYCVDNRMFTNRSVQAGCFAPLYYKYKKN